MLAYHGVSGASATPLGNLRRLHVDARRFEQHLELLSTYWKPLPLSDVLAALADGRLPRRAVAVTFDDGYRNVLTVALPLLRRYGVPATVFVLTGSDQRRFWTDRLEAAVAATSVRDLEWKGARLPLGSLDERRAALAMLHHRLGDLGPERNAALDSILERLEVEGATPDDDRDLLTWDEARALRQAGIEIGSHGDIHEPFTGRPLDELRDALVGSRRKLENELGAGRFPLAYPYGAWNGSVANAVRGAGFCCGATTDAGLNLPKADVFALCRFLMGADDDRPRLRASLSGVRAWFSRRRTRLE